MSEVIATMVKLNLIETDESASDAIKRLVQERDEARADIERLVWELAGCLTVAESRRPVEYKSEYPVITLAAVNRLAAEYERLRGAIKTWDAEIDTIRDDESWRWALEEMSAEVNGVFASANQRLRDAAGI